MLDEPKACAMRRTSMSVLGLYHCIYANFVPETGLFVANTRRQGDLHISHFMSKLIFVELWGSF